MIWNLLALVVILALLAGCGGGGGGGQLPPPTRIIKGELSLDPSNWVLQHSPGLPIHPTAMTGGGWKITMPGWGAAPTACNPPNPACPSLHYVVSPVNGALGGNYVTADFGVYADLQVTFSAKLKPTACDAPAQVRLYFQRQGDDMLGKEGTTEFYRWWSNPMQYTVEAGVSTLLRVPLQLDQWSSVWGRKDPVKFQEAVNAVSVIGITGGSCGFGHGFVVVGSGLSADLAMTRLAVE